MNYKEQMFKKEEEEEGGGSNKFFVYPAEPQHLGQRELGAEHMLITKP